MDGAIRPLPSLSVVLPAKDEEATIEQVVSTVIARCSGRVAELEVLVVDDGSRDRTRERVRVLAERHPGVRLLVHDRCRGYGAALRTGFDACRYEWVFLTDADGQFPLVELPSLLGDLERGVAVAGYRASRADYPGRQWLGRMWSLLARSALGVSARDVNCAFKLFPRQVLEVTPSLRSDGAAISAELLRAIARAGVRLREVPVEHRPRLAGRPTGARPQVAWQALRELAGLRGR